MSQSINCNWWLLLIISKPGLHEISLVFFWCDLFCLLWMNEWCIYKALYCVLLYTQSALQSCGVGGGGGGLSSTTTSVQHPLGWCDGCHRTTAPVRTPHTSYRWREESVIEPNKWMGIIRRPWLRRASGGNLASSTPGLYPYSLREVPWDDHRESGPRFNVSSERRMWILIVNKQNVIMKYGDTQRDSSPKNENSVINYSLSHCSRKCWPVRPSFF